MSYINDLTYRVIQDGYGVSYPVRKTLQFGGATCVDDPNNDKTIIYGSGGGGSETATLATVLANGNSASNKKITNLGTPQYAADAATKGYVDGIIGGDVDGPASATSSAIALYDGTSGKLIKDSLVTIDGSGNISTPGTVDGYDLSTTIQYIYDNLDGGSIPVGILDGYAKKSDLDGYVLLSSATPATEVVGGSGVVGVGTTAARTDHVHPLPAFGTTAGTFAEGNDSRFSATSFAYATMYYTNLGISTPGWFRYYEQSDSKNLVTNKTDGYITVLSDGYYNVSFLYHCNIMSNPPSTIGVAVIKNGTAINESFYLVPTYSTTDEISFLYSIIIYCNANDVLGISNPYNIDAMLNCRFTVSSLGGTQGLPGTSGIVTSTTTPAAITKATAVIGTDGYSARADHKHDISTAAATALTASSTNTEGTATSLARSDHTHSIAYLGNLDEITAITKEPTGFPISGGGQLSTISRVDLTRIFTIAPVGASFDIWIKGVKFTKSTAQTVQWTDAEGIHFFYFNSAGTLAVAAPGTDVGPVIAGEGVPVSNIYWDADNNVSQLCEERHGMQMDGYTHLYLHSTQGAAYGSGGALSSFSIDGTGDAAGNAQFGVEDTVIWDEDIKLSSVTYGQVLAAPAQIPIFYRSGAAGAWRKKTANTYPIIYSGTAGYTGASGRAPYNQWTGATWQLTEVGNGNFFLVHYYSCNNIESPIIGIQGQTEYTTTTAAQAGANTEMTTLKGTLALLAKEAVPLATVIYQTSTAYANTPKSRTRTTSTGANYIDWRTTLIGGGGAGLDLSSATPATEVVGGAGTAGTGTTASRADHVHPLPAFGTTSGTFAQGNDSRFLSTSFAYAKMYYTGSVTTSGTSVYANWSASESKGVVENKTDGYVTIVTDGYYNISFSLSLSDGGTTTYALVKNGVVLDAPINTTDSVVSIDTVAYLVANDTIAASRYGNTTEIAKSGTTLIVASVGGTQGVAGTSGIVTSTTTPAVITKATAVIGTDGYSARADHKHDISTAAAVGLSSSSTNTEGTATSLARSDHTHAVTGLGGSTNLDGYLPKSGGTMTGVINMDGYAIKNSYTGAGSYVDLTTNSSTSLLAVTISGLSASRTYNCTVGVRIVFYLASSHATNGSIDFVIDNSITTDGSSVATSNFQSVTPQPDLTRLPSGLAGCTGTISASTGGLTIYGTRPTGVEVYAKAYYWVNYFSDVT